MTTEAQWLTQVLDVAHYYGWLAYHVPDSRRVTERGMPDLVLLKPPRLIFAELKTDRGRLRPDQVRWLTALAECDVETAVWRPGDMPDVVAVLGPRGMPASQGHDGGARRRDVQWQR